MPKPNLFILGAPKCGTTSVSDWLQQHPNVYMCTPKEPHYFNFDSDHHHVKNIDSYEALFESAEQQHKVVGEASVWYLVSEVAATEILRYQKDAKYLVCVRNPIEAAVSLHSQKVFSGGENEYDFQKAWSIQWERKSGERSLPPTCTDYKQIMYGESLLFGHLLESLFEKVSREKVCVLLLDDIRSKPNAVYQRLEKFLNLPHYDSVEYRVVNKAKKRKYVLLAVLHRHFTIIKNKLGLRFNTGLAAKINKWNRKEKNKWDISDSCKQEITEYFREDIGKLQRMLKRDLSEWLDR